MDFLNSILEQNFWEFFVVIDLVDCFCLGSVAFNEVIM